MEFDRFDVPYFCRELMNLSVTLGVVDAVDVYCLCFKCGSDMNKVVADILDTAYSTRHSDGGSAHSALVKIADKFYKS